MKDLSHSKEKRKHPRVLVCLPLNFEMDKDKGGYPGLTLDASESGLLFHTLKEMPVGTRLNIEVFFPKELKLPNFKAEAEIIWKDVYYWEDWEGYQYGLKFIHISNEDYLKLNRVLSNASCLKEGQFIEDLGHDPTLIVRTK
jgi:hypothetical protein